MHSSDHIQLNINDISTVFQLCPVSGQKCNWNQRKMFWWRIHQILISRWAIRFVCADPLICSRGISLFSDFSLFFSFRTLLNEIYGASTDFLKPYPRSVFLWTEDWWPFFLRCEFRLNSESFIPLSGAFLCSVVIIWGDMFLGVRSGDSKTEKA